MQDDLDSKHPAPCLKQGRPVPHAQAAVARFAAGGDADRPARARHVLRKRIRELRMKLSLEIKEVAGRIGVGISTLSYWETGDRFPSPENIDAIAQYFGVCPAYLLADDCDPCASCTHECAHRTND